VLKEGVGEDFANKDRIAKLLRFASTHNDSTEQTLSLADYVARMKPEADQDLLRHRRHLQAANTARTSKCSARRAWKCCC
jgi:HSP90 family molecular chaperone